MDVLSLLRNKASWGFKRGNCEMQELQELHDRSKSRQGKEAQPLEGGQTGLGLDRQPLGICVANHPRFGVQSSDDGSFKDFDSLSNCSSSQKGPRAAPSELASSDADMARLEQAFKVEEKSKSPENDRDDWSNDEDREPFVDNPNSYETFSSLRIANNLLPRDMHSPTPVAVLDSYESDSDSEFSNHSAVLADLALEQPDSEEDQNTAFSPPLAQSIKRDAAFPTPLQYPKIISVATTETPTMIAHSDPLLRTIRAAHSEEDHQADSSQLLREVDTGRPGAMPSTFLKKSLGSGGIESSPQRKLRMERLRRQKEAADKVQQEMQEMGVLMEALLAQNPALLPPELSSSLCDHPPKPDELESLRARCTQQDEELSALRGKLEDIQSLCSTAQDRCALMECENQQMQSQVATLKWQLNLQEEFRFLTPPPNLSVQERELWRKKLLEEKFSPAADKNWQTTGTARKLALDDEAKTVRDSRPPRAISPDASAAYLAAVADARQNPTPEKLARAAKARGELGLLLGGSTGRMQRGGAELESFGEIQARFRVQNRPGGSAEPESFDEIQARFQDGYGVGRSNDGSRSGPFVRTQGDADERDAFDGIQAKLPAGYGGVDYEAQSPRSLIRNLSVSAEYSFREPSVIAPEGEGGRERHATFNTPLTREDAAMATPVAQTPVLSLASPAEPADYTC